jgi:hypothetical protein
MKAINWGKGFFRLTLILSVLLSLFCGGFLVLIEGPALIVFLGFVIPFGLVWGIYYLLLFIVRGFTDKS